MARKRSDTGDNPSYNLYVVMDLVRTHEVLSRADIVRRTGLAAQTVSNIVEVLLKADLLREERRPVTGRGQPPLDLRINPKARYALGVALAGGRMISVLCDLAGEEVALIDEAISSMDPADVLPKVAAHYQELLDQADVPRERMLGMGLVMPGLTESGQFSTLVSEHPWRGMWQDRPFIQELTELTSLPVLTDSDRSAAALSERLSGTGRGIQNFLYVYFGAGIGAGMVFAGLPYRGGTGRAGEIGHMVVVENGIPCGCGNRGCLERYASLQALQAALTGKAFGEGRLDPGLLSHAVREGNPIAMDWLDQAAGHLRSAIVSIENTLDLDQVVLGGIIPGEILDALIERLLPLPASVRSGLGMAETRLMKAAIGRTSPARGAAALVILQSTVPDFSVLGSQGQMAVRPGILGQRGENSPK
ncbi:ROK family transcriptional regulator [Rhizobium puerariae]|uniref:ROK family transcriptional regulator n=1 Tax=Rhizobium puerariae TaxID=1585791 RepID=A0ABV6AIX7_9HYPH